MVNVRLVAGICLAASAGWTADGPVFDTASVRPGNSNGKMGCTGGPETPSPGRLTCISATLSMLIALAYDVQPSQISGPDWIASAADGFDVEATVPPGSSRSAFRQMLRNLLAERFQLRLRQESRQTEVYALRVSAKGAKLKEGATHIPPVMDRVVNGQVLIEGRGAAMSTLAAVLTKQLRSRVSDETMLPGAYDFVLLFPAQDGAQLGKALEDQLGLELASTKVAVPAFIVEEALRTPVLN